VAQTWCCRGSGLVGRGGWDGTAEDGPATLLLAAIAAAIGATLCLMLDVSDVAMPAVWHAGRGAAALQRGSDFRIGLLQRQLGHAPDRHDSLLVHAILVELIHDRLAREHEIERDDPSRVATLLGPELAAFVLTPPSAKQFADVTYMSGILTRIEAL
jgi:hypothetical protein